ncbi:MAG: hypothetical protein NXI04_23425 [Planctomycetaceae bacterium]|nr:hypothetical protein [Planctomycetaceae bacterium]
MISAHIINGSSDCERLSELPDSIGYRLYRHNAAGVMLLDTFRPDRVPPHPFQYPLPTADVSLDLPAEMDAFTALYDQLYKLDLANSFKKSYINFSLLLHDLTAQPVLSIATDDDELDFACTVADGRVTRLTAHCGDLMVTSVNGLPHIQPLVPEFEGDAEVLSDTTEIQTSIPTATVSDRNVEWPTQLNGVALQEWLAFCEYGQPIIGLGTFDPTTDEADWELVRSS